GLRIERHQTYFYLMRNPHGSVLISRLLFNPARNSTPPAVPAKNPEGEHHEKLRLALLCCAGN
ncbi:MAG: hypothetical protein ACP5E2_15755, partial [Terracidiphilus sp.]